MKNLFHFAVIRQLIRGVALCIGYCGLICPPLMAQWISNNNDLYFNTGKVGIGVTAPLYRLHLVRPNGATQGSTPPEQDISPLFTSQIGTWTTPSPTTGLSYPQSYMAAFASPSLTMAFGVNTGGQGVFTVTNSLNLLSAPTIVNGYPSPLMYFNTNGVGIKTAASSSYSLNVGGNGINTSAINTNTITANALRAGNTEISGSGNDYKDLIVAGRIQTGDEGESGGVWLNANNDMFIGQSSVNPTYLSLWTSRSEWVFNLSQEGNVGIGTTPQANYRLAVEGKIGAREVQVIAPGAPWPDYVFEDDYKLMPLEEVEARVKAEKHLPEIPSAKEVEENGVALGEMQAKLLRKVEELTLYLIDLKKENEALKKKNDLLEQKNRTLEQKDTLLEERLLKLEEAIAK